MILKTVLDFINENSLIKNGDKILVGLSGGADSVCLTHILISLKESLNIQVFAAHVNHGIRGGEAQRDETFVKDFAEKYGVQLFIKHADVPSESKIRGISEELCGREIRYEFFDEITQKYSINSIATAHNKNDNAETVLMNFIRGTSVSGMCGIPVKRGNIIRPILQLTRDEIIRYIEENNLDYVTDSTNLAADYTRNKIRLNLIPQIQSGYNANFINTAAKNAANLNIDRNLLEELADDAEQRCVEGNTVILDNLKKEHRALQRRILYKALTRIVGTSDISSSYIDDMEKLISGQSGKRIDLPKNTEAVKEYGRLIIREKCSLTKDFEYKLKIGEQIRIDEIEADILIIETDKADKYAFTVPEGAELVIRNRREGDYFFPEGMTGRKKLKNYFTDEKIPQSERRKIGLLTVNGEIAYIIGKRRDRRFSFKDKGIKLIIK